MEHSESSDSSIDTNAEIRRQIDANAEIRRHATNFMRRVQQIDPAALVELVIDTTSERSGPRFKLEFKEDLPPLPKPDPPPRPDPPFSDAKPFGDVPWVDHAAPPTTLRPD